MNHFKMFEYMVAMKGTKPNDAVEILLNLSEPLPTELPWEMEEELTDEDIEIIHGQINH